MERRDLLGDAVDVAAAEQDLTGGHPHDVAVREAAAQHLRGLLVVAVVEQREDDPLGAEIEVRVGRGEAVVGATRQAARD